MLNPNQDVTEYMWNKYFGFIPVHLVPGRLHQGKVCRCQASSRAAGFLGQYEERPGASPRVWKINKGQSSSLFYKIYRIVLICCMTVSHRDLSMILCDPFASNTLVLSTVRNLQELLSQDALPRVRAPDQGIRGIMLQGFYCMLIILLKGSFTLVWNTFSGSF